jgi:hypothetical protein
VFALAKLCQKKKSPNVNTIKALKITPFPAKRYLRRCFSAQNRGQVCVWLLLDFALNRQHRNIIFLGGFADMRKKMRSDSLHEFQ